MIMAILSLMKLELGLRLRAGGGMAGLGFFVMMGLLIPFLWQNIDALQSQPDMFLRLAPNLLWLLAVLAILINIEGLFKDAMDEGRMDQYVLSPVSLHMVLMVKTLVFWAVAVAPIIVIAPLLMWLYTAQIQSVMIVDFPVWHFVMLAVSFLIGTMGMAFIGGFLSMLTLSLKRGVGLIIFLAMPFFLPFMIFGSQVMAFTTEQSLLQSTWQFAPFLFLCATSLFAIALSQIFSPMAMKAHFQ